MVSHHQSAIELQKASLSCPWCKFLWSSTPSSIQQQWLEAEHEIANQDVGTIKDQGTGSYALHMDCNPILIHFRSLTLLENASLPSLDLTLIESSTAGSRDHLDSSTSSYQTLNTLQSWLIACIQTHSTCDCSQKSEWRPNRLIDVGHNGQGNVRLCLGEDLRGKVEYLSLSHCWGGSEIHKLTKNNYNEFLVEIQLNRLSRTFVDAIDLTRRLGFRYLWIDSLCIVQDDEKDWQIECGLMEKVYQYCTLNIAAAHAKNGNVGLYTERDPVPLSITLDRPNNENLNHTAVKDISHGRYWCRPWVYQWERQVDESPLHQRGWVLQERFLSPRIVHFGTNMIWWECAESQFCEAFPGHRLDLEHKASGRVILALQKLRHDGNEEIMQDQWIRLVSAYSGTKLTFGKDKLVAFAGIAKAFQPNLAPKTCEEDQTSPYVAGLWSTNLIFGLLWEYYPPSFLSFLAPHPDTVDQNTLSRPYRAPSWSWASHDYTIRYPLGWKPRTSHAVLANIASYSITPSTADPFLQVLGCTLTLRGMLLKRINWPDKGHEEHYDNGTLHISSSWSPDGPKFEQSAMTESIKASIILIPICFIPDMKSQHKMYCLILLPCSSRKHHFKRVGICILGFKEESAAKHQHLAEVEQALSCLWESKAFVIPLTLNDPYFKHGEMAKAEEHAVNQYIHRVAIL